MLTAGGDHRAFKELRQKKGLTQLQLANKLYISQNTCSRFESGVRPMPAEILIRLSEYYEVSTDYILRLTDNPKRNL